MQQGKKRGLGRPAFTYSTILIVVLGFIFVLAKCSTRPASPFAKEYVKAVGDTIDVGIMLNPTIYYPEGDTIVGRDYEILKRISAKHGVPMKFHPFVPLSDALERLDAGLYDIVVASMPLTSTLRDNYLMTNPVYTDRQVLVQRRDSTAVQSLLQLAGETLWVPESSSIAERIDNLSEEIGDSIIVKSYKGYSAEHLLILVAQGVIGKAVINERIARELAPDYSNIDIDTPVSFTQFQSWAVSKSRPELLDSLNAWLN